MKKAVYNILPETEKILKTMGEQIKLARLRRSLAAGLVAERAGIMPGSDGVWQPGWWQNVQGSAALLCGKLKKGIHR